MLKFVRLSNKALVIASSARDCMGWPCGLEHRLFAIGIVSRPPCRLRLGTRLNPKGQSPVAAYAANRPTTSARKSDALAAAAAPARASARASGQTVAAENLGRKAKRNGCTAGEAGGQPCAQRTANLFIGNFGTNRSFASGRVLKL